VHVYRVLGLVFLICLPVALALVIFPTKSLLRKRIRSGAVGFIGLGCLFACLLAGSHLGQARTLLPS
jgi:hypothetical protein